MDQPSWGEKVMANLIIDIHQPQGDSIVVQTRKGADVENMQTDSIPRLDLHMADVYRKRHCLAKERSGPTGMYNCHGLTFASRRTRIWNPVEVDKILRDDDYVEVDRADVLPGDVVVYYQNGDLQHSGTVVELGQVGSVPTPRIVSKWGNGQETIHSLNDCPYSTGATVRYYRIKDQ